MISRNDPINRGFSIDELIAELLGVAQATPQQTAPAFDRSVNTTGGIDRAQGIDLILGQVPSRTLPGGTAMGPRTPTNPGIDPVVAIPNRTDTGIIPGLVPAFAGTQPFAPNIPNPAMPMRGNSTALEMFLRDISARTAKPARSFGILPKMGG